MTSWTIKSWTIKRWKNQGLKYRTLVLLAVLALALGGCGGDDDSPTAPGGGGGGGGGGDIPAGMTCTVDGAKWTSVDPVVINNGGVIVIGGSDLNGETGIGFAILGAAVGDYPIGGAGQFNTATVTSESGGTWIATAGEGSGSIKVTTFTATQIAGTFSFTVVNQEPGQTPASRTITAGEFNLEF